MGHGAYDLHEFHCQFFITSLSLDYRLSKDRLNEALKIKSPSLPIESEGQWFLVGLSTREIKNPNVTGAVVERRITLGFFSESFDSRINSIIFNHIFSILYSTFIEMGCQLNFSILVRSNKPHAKRIYNWCRFFEHDREVPAVYSSFD